MQILTDMPNTFTPFRNKVEKLCKIMQPLQTPTSIPSIPQSIIDNSPLLKVQLSYKPKSLLELGYTMEQAEFAAKIDSRSALIMENSEGNKGDGDDVGSGGLNLVYKGGETAALQHLKEYIWGGKKDLLRNYFDTRNGMIGKNYSTKLSPYLAHGNISPRYIASGT